MQRYLCNMAEGKSDVEDRQHDDDAPTERSIGADALKAFAHPLRMRMYQELGTRRSATASQLARALGESSGQTSYHLRQLERHGFVEDDPTHTGGRERWWRPVGFALTDAELAKDPSGAQAVNAVVGQVIAERAATLTRWWEHLDGTMDAANGQLSSSTFDLTDDEATALIGDLMKTVKRYSQLTHDRPAPEGSRRYRVHTDVVPLTFCDETDGAGSAIN